MTTDQGADERRIAHYLRQSGIGPDADPDGRDWLDRLWDDMEADEQPAAQPRGGGRLPDWRARKAPLTVEEQLPVDDEWEPLLTDGRTPPVPAAAPWPPATPTAEEPPAEDQAAPGWWTATPGYYPAPHWPTVPAPRTALSAKTRRGLYVLTAAGAGYGLGLAPLLRGWLVECGTQAGVPAALVLGIGGSLVLAHVWDRRTRHWWPGLAWAARIPLASALLALGLYAPGAVH